MALVGVPNRRLHAADVVQSCRFSAGICHAGRHEPRSIWTGHLKLELLTIPVRLYTAINDAEKVSFNQLHKDCHQRLRQHLDCPIHGGVERDAVVKGFELEKDRFVVLNPGDLEAIKLESTGTIELVQFVTPSEVDPSLWDTPYYLGPDGLVAEPAFAVVREAMRRRRRVGLDRSPCTVGNIWWPCGPRAKGVS